MIKIVGNTLNATNKKVLDKMNKMDFEFIKREVMLQIERGAEYIELNAVSLLGNEIPFLHKAIEIIESLNAKVLVRTENVAALEEVVKTAQKEVIIGDIEFDYAKIDRILEIIEGRNAKMIASIRENEGEEQRTPERSLLIAQKYIDYLLDRGVKRCDILLDPVVRSLEESCCNGIDFLKTLELFILDFPQVPTIANLGDLSEGLPRRNLITSFFLALAIEKGIDYAIINVMEPSNLEAITTSMAILGKDRNMQVYLNQCRNNRETKRKGAERSWKINA